MSAYAGSEGAPPCLVESFSYRKRVGRRRVVCSVSGGKDSAATSLRLTEMGIEHDRVFADTGWEHPLTYEYLRGPLTAKLGPITEVRGERTFEELVRHKRIFPNRTKRFCTTELKVLPIMKWIDALDEDVVNAIGVRRDESAARREALEWEMSRGSDSVEIWRVIVSWSLPDVLAIHARHGLALNPLYALGAKRVGCWPCIHENQRGIVLVADTDPERIDRIRALETQATQLAAALLGPGEALDWNRAMFSIRESKKTAGPDGKVRRRHLPLLIDDAVAWARRGVARGDKQAPIPSCGEWGLCDTEDPQLTLAGVARLP